MQRTSTRFIGCVWRQPSVRLLMTLHLMPQYARIGQRQLATSYSSDKTLTKPSTQTAAATVAAVTANTSPSSNPITSTSNSSSNNNSANTNITSPSSSPTATLTAQMQTRTMQSSSGNATHKQHGNMQRGGHSHFERSRSPSRNPTSKMQQSSSSNNMQRSSSNNMQRSRSFEGPRHIMREDNMWRDAPREDTKWLRPRDPARYKPDFGLTEPHTLRKQFMRSPDERTRDAMGRDWEQTMRSESNRRRRAVLVQQQKDHDMARTIEMRKANKDRRLSNKEWKRESLIEADTKPKTD